ncbi:MAG: sigma-70 family RNA polymerase sigma factor [Ruminococcaceae bacterium]|nr:sigma-70 family RNA polymerase sigma factor [Oscillospiraceae bacterium]
MSEPFVWSNEDFEAFYLKHFKFVYRVCFIYMKNSFDAEDCTEDVFAKVLSGNYGFNSEEHERKWLSVTAMNLCKDKLKSWWHKKTASLEQCEEMSAEGGFETDETLKEVMKLPPKYKDVIYLYYYMGYKTEEIAEILRKPSSTVRNHMREAREVLKTRLGGEFK